MEKKLPGTAQMDKYRGERTCHGQWANRVQKGLLDTSGSHFFDNGSKKALHVYLDEVRQSRWLVWSGGRPDNGCLPDEMDVED